MSKAGRERGKTIKKSRFSEQQIAFILKQADEGTSVEEAFRKAGISQQTYYRWRKKCAGLMPSELRRHEQFGEENSPLEWKLRVG